MTTSLQRPAPASCHKLLIADEDVGHVEPSDLIRIVPRQDLIREFDTRLLGLKDAGLVNGPLHASIRQDLYQPAFRRCGAVGTW